MVFDLATLLKDRRGDAFELHTSHMNHQLAGVLETLGFDRSYVSGSGCYLYDTEGNRYLDLLSGFGVHALGRNHPAVTQALHEALALDLPNMVQIDCALLPALLAERLLPYAHRGINRVFFCNSGTEAVEAAIKFARCATKRPRILYCSHAFHGLTTGSLALNGGAEFRRGFGRLLPDTTEVPFGANCGTGTSPRSSSNRSRARGSTSPQTPTGTPWQRCAASSRRSWWPMRCRLASGEPAGSSATSTGASSPTSSPCPRPSLADSSRSAPRCAPTGCSRRCSARWTGQWCTRAPSDGTSWQWWQDSPPCRCSKPSNWSSMPRRPERR